jgi:hypothetical protein
VVSSEDVETVPVDEMEAAVVDSSVAVEIVVSSVVVNNNVDDVVIS